MDLSDFLLKLLDQLGLLNVERVLYVPHCQFLLLLALFHKSRVITFEQLYLLHLFIVSFVTGCNLDCQLCLPFQPFAFHNESLCIPLLFNRHYFGLKCFYLLVC